MPSYIRPVLNQLTLDSLSRAKAGESYLIGASLRAELRGLGLTLADCKAEVLCLPQIETVKQVMLKAGESYKDLELVSDVTLNLRVPAKPLCLAVTCLWQDKQSKRIVRIKQEDLAKVLPNVALQGFLTKQEMGEIKQAMFFDELNNL